MSQVSIFYVGLFSLGLLTLLCSLLRAKDSRRTLLFAVVLTLGGWFSLTLTDLFDWKASLAVALIGTKLGSQATRDNFYEILGLKRSRSVLAVHRLMMTIGYVIGPLMTISAFTVSSELTAWLFTAACLLLLLLLVTQWNSLLPNFDLLTQDSSQERPLRHPFQVHQMASQELLKVPLLSPEDAPDFSVRGVQYRLTKLNSYGRVADNSR
jgi:hypothetical protein